MADALSENTSAPVRQENERPRVKTCERNFSLATSRITLFSSVGGRVFGAGVIREMCRLGIEAKFDFDIPIQEYWGKKGFFRRLLLRWKMYVSYPCSAAFRTLFGPKRALIVTTNPFFLPILLGSLAKVRGHRVFQWLFDLYPDALIASGSLRPDSLIVRLLKSVTQHTLQICDATAFLGELQREHVNQTYGLAARSKVITVGADGILFGDVATRLKETIPSREPLVFLYSGHFGRGHDFQLLKEFFEELDRMVPANGVASLEWSRIHFKFYASGPHLDQLLQSLKHVTEKHWRVRLDQHRGLDFKLEVGGNLEDAEWSSIMCGSQMALITMVNEAARVLMPSKTYSAMLAGQGVLAICPLNSDLARTILRHECGWVVCPPIDRHAGPDSKDGLFLGPSGLMELLLHLANHPEEVQRARHNAFRAASEFYRADRIAEAWVDFIRSAA